MADVRSEIITIEKAIVNALSLAYQFRYPPVDSVTELRLLNANSTDIPSATGIPQDNFLRFVTQVGRVYRFDGYSLEIDDNLNVIKPHDLTDTQRGRWIKQDVGEPGQPTYLDLGNGVNFRKPLHIIQTGYAKAVEPYQGQLDRDEELTRIMGNIPAFLVHWIGDEYLSSSQYQGALYKVKHKFSIICLSSCLRPDASSLYGSPIPGEYAYDPGLYRMMGDVRYLFNASKLGVHSVDYTDLGQGEVTHEDWDSRLFMGEVELIVRDTVNIADEDLIELREQAMNPHLTASVGPFDIVNYIASGLRVPIQQGRNVAPEAGSAYIDGQLVEVNPPPHLFPTFSDTYRDLKPDGSFYYTSVTAGHKAPPLIPGTLRVGLTVTDGSNITFDTFLQDSNLPWKESYVIKEN